MGREKLAESGIASLLRILVDWYQPEAGSELKLTDQDVARGLSWSEG